MKKLIVACAIASLAAVAVPSSAQAYTPPGTGTTGTHETWTGSWTSKPPTHPRSGAKYTVYVTHKHHHKHHHSHH